ncbi:MAG: DUF1015 domain-containing protein [Flavobacteriales bacterium]|nr:DUF1015 domain-containing protein [Flavobacteriales bacterium]
MAKIIPFKAVRPPRDKAHLVASRSYVTYKPNRLRRKLRDNPYSFIHIINPEFGRGEKTSPNTKERFLKVKERFREFEELGYIVQDPTDSLYAYRQINQGHTYTGIVAGVHVDEYEKGHIKVHEHTITKRVGLFTDYLDTCDFNAEPVLLTYSAKKMDISDKIDAIVSERPEYDFTTTDEVRHQLWMISDPKEISAIQSAFEELDCLYIADGHHRMASSAHLGEIRRERPDWKPESICNYALAFMIPDTTLGIEPFHRLLKFKEGIDEDALLNKLKKHFEVKKVFGRVLPDKQRVFGMRLPTGWYELKLRREVDSPKVSDHLDAVILADYVLEPILGIADQKTDPRIRFVPGIEPIGPFEKQIDEGTLSAAFTLHPTSNEDLFSVADAGEVMPPKSTYIEPKLRSGLTIMKLS